jgi:hypothetical protein
VANFDPRDKGAKGASERTSPGRTPVGISKSYFQVTLSVQDWRKLLIRDDITARSDPGLQVIYKLWPDFPVKPLVDRSVATVKAGAASKSYSATGVGNTWAVVDSGIDGTHPYFGSKSDKGNSAIYHPSVADIHYDLRQTVLSSLARRQPQTIRHRATRMRRQRKPGKEPDSHGRETQRSGTGWVMEPM